ncbi:MAG: hypothetical protein ACT4PU_09945 [Planctomycetota bacterium]
MSSIGKIFVVVNLVLALLVLGAAGALLQKSETTQADLKAKTEALATAETQLTEATAQFAERERQLNSEKLRLQEDKDDLEVAKTNAERNVARAEESNQQLRDDVTKINSKLDALESSYASALQRTEELNDQNGQLRGEAVAAKEAQRQAEMARRDAADELASLRRQIDDVNGQLAAVQEEAATNARLLEVAKATSGFDPTAVLAMPRIEASLAEVDLAYGFVILDKGASHQVQRGFTFDVHRAGTFLGRVRVDEVYPGHSTARIELAAPNTLMQRFDKASTYLN